MIVKKKNGLLSALALSTMIAGSPALAEARNGGMTFPPYRQQAAGDGSVILVVGAVAVVGALIAAMSGGSDDGEKATSGEPVEMDRVRAAAESNPQASDAAIAAVKGSDEYSENPAHVSANLANKIALGLTGKGVRVGVMDMGIQRGLASFSNVDFGTPFIADAFGDAAVGDGGLTHGSLVAQVLAGGAGDGDRARGVAPGVTLHDISYLREFDDGLKVTQGDLVQAFRHAAKNDLDFVNLSMAVAGDENDLAGSARRQLEERVLNAVSEATSSGTVFVIAAGNGGKSGSDNGYSGLSLLPEYAFGNVITVVSLERDGSKLVSSSNACGQVLNFCLAAVGTDVPVVDASGKVVGSYGTSIAAPVVTGSMALLKEQFPELSSGEVVQLVFLTADDLGAAGVDRVYGHGRLNMNKAFRPVGEMRVVSGTDVSSSALAVSEVGILTPEMAGGLSDLLRETEIAALDDTNRAFLMADGILAGSSGRRPDPIVPAFFEYRSDAGGFIVAGESGAWVGHGSGFGVGHINPELLLPGAAPTARLGYSPLGMAGDGPVATYEGRGVFAGAAFGEDDARSLWVGRTTGDLTYMAGAIFEDDALMGTSRLEGPGRTFFVSAEASRPLTDRVTFSLSGSYARGSVSGGGVLADLDAEAASGMAAVSVRDVAGGDLTLSLGAPLTVFRGKARVDAPVGRDPSDGGPTTGVIRAISDRSFTSVFPADLGVSYARDFTPGTSGSVTAVRRFTPGGDDETFFGIALSSKF